MKFYETRKVWRDGEGMLVSNYIIELHEYSKENLDRALEILSRREDYFYARYTTGMEGVLC